MTRRVGPRGRLLVAAWLLLVWVVLWRQFDAATLIFGAVAALGVVTVFPPATGEQRFAVRPLWVLALAAYVLGDVALSALRVGRDAVLLGGEIKAAIVEIDLLSDVDRVVAVSTTLLTLSPGTFVVEIDRDRMSCHVYALGTRNDSDIEALQRLARRLQRLVVRAFGPAGGRAAVGKEGA